jgi:hypothetical protein
VKFIIGENFLFEQGNHSHMTQAILTQALQNDIFCLFVGKQGFQFVEDSSNSSSSYLNVLNQMLIIVFYHKKW